MTLVQTEPKSIKIGTTDIKRVTIRPGGVEKQIRPTGWQPGANTIAYYPLTSTTTVNDMSGNNRNLTNNNVVFGTYGGVNCATFSGNGTLTNTSITNTLIGQNFTILGWIYYNGGNNSMCIICNNSYSGGYRGWNIDERWNNSEQPYCIRNEFLPSGGNLIPLKGVNDSKRHFFCYTHNSGNNSVGYTDLISRTKTQSITMDGIANFCIGARLSNGSQSGYWVGGISGIIIENRERTAQEISDYYNLTKGNYGL